MSRKEERLKAEGMEFCLRFLKNHTPEELAAECKRRGVTHTPLALTRSDEQEFIQRVRHSCLDTVLIMSLAVLHDSFGFGKKRANRYKKAFNDAAELLADDVINWDELRAGVKEQLGIDQVIRWGGREYVSESQRKQREVSA